MNEEQIVVDGLSSDVVDELSKERRKAYMRAYLKAYRSTPDQKAYSKAYSKEYGSTPERKAYKKKHNLMKKYNLSIDAYNFLLLSQNHCCAICDTNIKETGRFCHVDHNHATGKVRALLCHNCNSTLGYVKESQKILASAIEYLNMIPPKIISKTTKRLAANDKYYRKEYKLLQKYGLSLDSYNVLLNVQDCCCKICRNTR